jgi:DNA-binding MarR family transcriptional regulator
MASRPARALRRAPAPEEGGEPAASESSLDLSALTQITGYPLRRAQMAVFEDFNRRFAALGLSPAQYSALVTIGDNPGRKQSEIAGALGIQRPNFVAMMDELERRGLAERLRSDLDRRSHALLLTPAGSALVARARAVQAEQEDAIAQTLGPEGRKTLVSLLHRLAKIE